MHSKSLNIVLPLLFTISSLWAGNYNLDKAHTNIGFEVTHMVITNVTGKFTDFEVNLNWNPQDLKTSSVEAIIKIASVDTENERRDNHLSTSDFFDAPNHPDMIFKSSVIEKTENGFLARGTLNMRGVSKEISLPFIVKGPINDNWGNQRIGIMAETTINRQEWGVSYGGVMDNGGLMISDEVIIKINGQFIKTKEVDISKKN